MPPEKKHDPSQDPKFVFGRRNYILLLLSVLLVSAGYLLMSGGGSDDPNVFNPEIFSFRRITLAPLVVLAGYITGMIAIMSKPDGGR